VRYVERDHATPSPRGRPHPATAGPKARRVLGFEPNVSLREGLERTLSQFEAHH
jgi:nucleoside-diphosphate-sugar epimerase